MKSAMNTLWRLGPVLAVIVCLPAWAQDATTARNLAAACFTCHGTDGKSIGGVPPSLAGQDKKHMLQQLLDFKAGKLPATIMHQQAKGYTDQELEAIAGYFAGVKSGTASTAPGAPSSRY